MAVAKAKKVSTVNKDRMHFRLAPDIKARVARAASITGQGLTDFAISALSEPTKFWNGATRCCSMPRPIISFSNRSATAANLRRRRAPPLLAIGAVSGRA